MGRAATLVAVLSASCINSSQNVCSDGSICPGGYICDETNDRCITPEQQQRCVGLNESDECEVGGMRGGCRIGACIPYYCGDGYVTEMVGEDCEGDRLAGKTCSDFGFYPDSSGTAPGLACTSSCTYDLGSEAMRTGCYANQYCGDLAINGNELCDGPEERTCVSIGFDAGTTTCNLQCGFSIGDCSRFGWNPESLSEVIAFAIAGSAHDDQWAFGLGGKAMHYEGAFWNSVPTGVQNDLVNGWSFSRTDTWAVGQSSASPARPSVMIRWNGATWSTVTGAPVAEYLDVWGPSSGAVFVASDAGILKFDGASWTTVSGFSGTPKQMRGTSATDIWVSTTGGPLMHYNGSAWTDRSPPGMTVQFLDANKPNDVWTIGFKTADQSIGMIAHYNGTSWDTPWETQDIYNVVASSAPNDAWIGGVDGIMRHWDGIAWSRSANIGSSPSGLTALSGMMSFGPDEVVGVSTLNLAYRYRGQAFGVVTPLGTNPFDAPQNLAVWGSAANNQYVTNVKGEVWHFDGTTWELSYTVPGGMPVNDVWGIDDPDPVAENVWIVADDGNAYHYDGTNWTPSTVVGVPLYRVWANASDVWVFGATGAYHKEDASWAYTPLAASGTVESVSGSSSNNVWAVQRNPSSVWRYDGNAWMQMVPPASYPVLAVAAVSDTDVHVSAEEGRFEHWNGSSWDPETALPVLDDIRFLSYTAADDVVGASERDLVHFNGSAWSTMRTPVDFVPNTADYLPIVDLDVRPGRIDMLQFKYRVRTLIRTRPLICRVASEDCADGVDNDCDDLIDKLDIDQCP